MDRMILSIDVGGTFCDCLLERNGHFTSFKLLSSGKLRAKVVGILPKNRILIEQHWALPYPEVLKDCKCKAINSAQVGSIISFDPNAQTLQTSSKLNFSVGDLVEIYIDTEVVVFAAHLITGIPIHQNLDQVELKIGTTKGTNALLESKGYPVVWIANQGFKDLLYIKTQQRPHLFQLDIPEPKSYLKKVIELDARMNAKGGILKSLGAMDQKKLLAELPKNKDTPIAVSLMHAYKNPKHELAVKNLLVKQGYRYISVSHELNPAIHLLPRTETTVANAYLSPIINSFVESIAKRIAPDAIYFNSSSGQLIPARQFNAKDSLLSGPAGGIKGAEYFSRFYSLDRLITFDMGGTSTDTARIDGKADLRFHTQIGELNLATPAYQIETVAAGGGSIVEFKEGRFTVGPHSAGADPGPACYGKGGPFTLTDVNLLLDKLNPEAFSIPISINDAERAFIKLLKQAGYQNSGPIRKKILNGIETIANETMAAAIRKISFSKGFDPAEYSLLVYGGAGGLHACALAEILSIKKIVLPFEAGIFSALGISKTDPETILIHQVNESFETCQYKIASWFDALKAKANRKLKNHRRSIHSMRTIVQEIYLRYKGQDQIIAMDWNDSTDVIPQFKNKYFKLYQTEFDYPIEVERIVLKQKISTSTEIKRSAAFTKRTTIAKQSGLIDWESLEAGQSISGPSIVFHRQASCFVQRGWSAILTENKDLILQPDKRNSEIRTWMPSIERELFNNRFKSIAEQMGAQLQFSAFSVNVKERLDFSCAILDDQARLLVNAPHIPVHLGSLGLAARLILAEFPLGDGDIILCNHPKYGGSHLPDLTLLKAVFDKNKKCIGYVINRAHHAEIGGMTPGSMPAFATNLEQEGVIFRPTYIYKKGKPQWKLITGLLNHATYPSRKPELNILDLKAGISALSSGEKQLQSLAQQYGTDYLHKQMRSIFNQSHRLIDQFISSHTGKEFIALEKLDDGKSIHLKVKVFKNKLIFDFTGSSSPHPGNLNANPSIVQSVLLYLLRLLCNIDITLNEGLMKNVKVINPISFINPDFKNDDRLSPAVVGGNTEVSQRLTDTLIKAFELAACSQGTMNNFLFGNDRYTYYETIGGGTGAGPGFNGRSAIHQHMTNTKITDPEELEFRYPVLLKEFSIRKGSGGNGKFKGGDGIIRVIQFLEAMTVTLLAQHRIELPFGMMHGQPGMRGQQSLNRKGKKIKISANESFEVLPNDEFRIETPGGGGWGK